MEDSVLDLFNRLKTAHKSNEDLLAALEDAINQRYEGIDPSRMTQPYAKIEKVNKGIKEVVGLVRLVYRDHKLRLGHRRMVGFVGDDHPVNPQTSDFEDVLLRFPDLLVELEAVRDQVAGRVTSQQERADRVREALSRAITTVQALD